MERTIIIIIILCAFGARKSEQARQGGRSGGKDKDLVGQVANRKVRNTNTVIGGFLNLGIDGTE